MKTIEIRVAVSSDGKLSIKSHIDMPVGEYNAVLVLEEQPIQNRNQTSLQTSLNNAQLIFRQYVPADRKLSEELIQERRTELLGEWF